MKRRLRNAIAAVLVVAAGSAFAYSLKKPTGGACSKDGSTCNVYCNNGYLAGSMNWNGTLWTTGVDWDANQDALARRLVAASGTACK